MRIPFQSLRRGRRGPAKEDRTPGIAAVRQTFEGLDDIIDKHWSGAVNAPENRLFDEGVDRTSHDLIQWDQYPTYDGHSVTFSGTLLNDAVLYSETLHQAREGGYSNFSLSHADKHEYAGSILPPLEDGTNWILDDPGDSVAAEYRLYERAFIIKFPFPQALVNPSGYIVLVLGFRDGSRTPTIGENIDLLGYARIRVGGASNVPVKSPPGAHVTGSAGPVRINLPVPVTATFSEPVFGFTSADIDVGNGTIGNFTGADGDTIYTFDVTPNAIGMVTVDIAAGVAEDADGNGNTAAIQLSLGITYDGDGDGGISKDEAIAAIRDYFSDRINKDQAIAVIRLYFAS